MNPRRRHPGIHKEGDAIGSDENAERNAGTPSGSSNRPWSAGNTSRGPIRRTDSADLNASVDGGERSGFFEDLTDSVMSTR